MVNSKISALSALTKSTVASNDVLPIVDTSTATTKNITYGELMDVQDNNFRVSGSSDNTKKVAFEVDGLTTATTRTITVPDSDITLVGTTNTQTISGKTLTSPKINVGADATGDIYYRDGSGNLARLPIGSSGQILDVSGSGLPEWISNPSAANSSSTVKGVVELATSSEITAGTATGGTGAALVVTPDQLASSGAYSKSVDIQTFTTAGTTSWTKPTNAKFVEVTVIGGGASGGGGSNFNQGGGGGGGGYGFKKFSASALGSTETVVVGAGGVAVVNSVGIAGGASSFGTSVLLKANGGGVNTGGSGGSGGTASGDIKYTGGSGGNSGATGGSGTDTAVDPSPRGGGGIGTNGVTPASGGAGGSFITNYIKAGGAGGNTSGSSGTDATTTTIGLLYGGVGGGGAGSSGGGVGGNGGAGGFPGGGGGAGGATGSKGGNGADGAVVVVTYF